MELEFEDLYLAYQGGSQGRGVRALDGVSGALRGGELLVVIGPNGAGKSTLVKVLAGLESPDAGRVCVGGRDIESLAARERARLVAVVPQSLVALPEVHVGDFVLGGRYAHLRRLRGPGPADREAVLEALRACDCEGLEGRLMRRLSGGQRQRVLIARALAQAAPVLLVDEPTSSLDPAHQLAIFELLANLAAQGRAVLAVTHDLNLASQFASRLWLMQRGRRLREGPAAGVLVPSVLRAVYGPHLFFGELAVGSGERRPFVLPWARAAEHEPPRER